MDFLTHHLLRRSAERSPDKEALVHGDERLSYAQVDERTSRLANALLELGLARGERVGIFLDKSIEESCSIFAISKAGGVFVPVNQQLFPEQVKHILHDGDAVMLITSSKKLAGIREILGDIPTLRSIVCVDGVPDGDWPVECHDWTALLEAASPECPPDRCVSRDLGSFLYTSGSTGKPKGVVLTHANLVAGSRIVSTYLEITADDRLLSILPFSFDYGLNQLLTAFEKGGTLVLLTFTFPDQIVQALLKERITGFAGVPPLWNVVTSPRSSVYKHEFPDLRYITNSGGAVPEKLRAAFKKAFPTTRPVLMYGLTEAFRSTYLPPEQFDSRPGSMGKAIPDTEIFVVNDEGKRCEPGEVGELVHRGPTVSLGYWKRPDATAAVIRPNPFLPEGVQSEEMVCYSGDLVRMDEDGYLYFVGRRDSTIKCSGNRISPTEVEEVVHSFGGIQDVAVIGVPDEAMGQAIKAFVVPHAGKELDRAELLAHCAGKMPRYMLPKEIELLSEIPKTSSGKVDYKTLQTREAELASEAK